MPACCRPIVWMVFAALPVLATAAPPQPPSPPGQAIAPSQVFVPAPAFPPSPNVPMPVAGVMPLDLETALGWTLAHSPSLATARQNLCVSAEAVEVARRFPTSLNPTLAVNYEPWTFVRDPSGVEDRKQTMIAVSWMQPIEFGGRRELRTAMAQATFSQTRWNILQTELGALVQTYKSHQTATYRRDKLAVAQRLIEFNTRLLESLHRQLEANQVPAADVVLAEVESQATAQQFETARQEYAVALVDLRNQIGFPQYAATLEPAGELRVPSLNQPDQDETLVQLALCGRPDVGAARAQVENSRAAVSLARADRIPIPSIGPMYEHDQDGVSFYGISASTPIPILNSGQTLVQQREAELRRDCVALEQTQRMAETQVRAALARWRQAQESFARVHARLEPIRLQTERMQRLYEAGQTDLVKLLQVRMRLIEADNVQLDLLWQTTQAYADLLTAIGGSPLLGVLPPEGPGK